MDVRSLICSGFKIPNSQMSASDLDWAMQSAVIQQDNNGYWYHTKITDRDRKVRQNFWNPDTGPWRKGINY
jgi:hypothetical protein